MSDTRLTFRPEQRLHTPADYEAVFARKHSAGDPVLLVFVLPRAAGPTRLGTSVSKKCGNSVVRHAVKRAIREGFRHLQHELPPALDIVVIPRPGVQPTTAQVLASLPKLIAKAVKKASRKIATEPLASQDSEQAIGEVPRPATDDQ